MAKKQLDWPERAFSVRELPEEYGPGNILLIEARYEHVTEIVSGFGKLGVPAEQVAKRAAGRMQGYLESTAFAGPYLADQLLLPFAIAGGGVFTTVKPSEHTKTAADVIALFLDRRTVFQHEAGGIHRVTVG
jgi:RNA 3'-terminal phosphate cyclase (ATP)